MSENALFTVWVGAFRYYVGRMTYAVGSFCQEVISNWNVIPENARVLIRRELEEEFAHDDKARADCKAGKQWSHLPLGNDCDRAEWEKVRALWA